MELALYLKAVVLGIVEGLTEFLPISSTGHLIIAGQLLNFHDEKAKVFEIVIQSGAMLAIVWEYRARFWEVLTGLARPDDRDARVGRRVGNAWGAVGVLSSNRSRRFIVNLAVAFMPAAILGLAFGKLIKSHLFHAVPVALAFIVGGIIILWVERTLRRRVRVDSVDDMSWHDALKVGFAQALALIPGTSRSGATIIGGMLFGLSRRAATEFSFFLAVPTLMAAGAYDLYKNRALLSAGDVGIFSVGFGVSFVSAFFCVRWLIRYISRHDFSVFAWYRIAFGAIVLATAYYGLVDWAP